MRWRFGDLVEAQGNLIEVDPRDRAVGARLRRRGIWSEAETALCRLRVRPGMTVLDIGANLGYFTLLLSDLVGPRGQVFAIEPDPHNLRLLRGNVSRNRRRNVTVLPTALSRQEGTMPLYRSRDNFGDHRLGHGEAGREMVQVPVTTLDALLAHIATPIDFIKMDIQGAEAAVLAGGQSLFRSDGPLQMISELWPDGMRSMGDDPLQYLLLLHEHGFRLSYLARGKRLQLLPLPDREACEKVCHGGEVNLFAERS